MYTIKENVVTEIISYIAVAVLMICITLMVSASLKGVPVTDFIPDRPD